MRSALSIVLALLAALAAPALATAQGQIPPGVSGADEYTEGVPDASGNNPSVGAEGSLPDGVADDLASEGATGAEAAEVLGATAPAGGAAGGGGTGSPSDDASGRFQAAVASDGDGGWGDVIGGALGTSDGGMGILLPIILAATLLGAIGFAVARRRSGGTAAG